MIGRKGIFNSWLSWLEYTTSQLKIKRVITTLLLRQQDRSLAAALYGWKIVAVENRRFKSKIHRYSQRKENWIKLTVLEIWRHIATFQLTSSKNQAYHTLFERRQRRQSAKVFNAVICYADIRLLKKKSIEQARRTLIKAGWNTFRHHSEYRCYLEVEAEKLQNRLRCRKMLRSWLCWRQREQSIEHIVPASRGNFVDHYFYGACSRRVMCRAFTRWSSWHIKMKCTYLAGYKVLMRKTRSLVSNSWSLWMDAMECRYTLTIAAYKTIMMDQNRVLHQAIKSWVGAINAEIWFQRILKRCLEKKARCVLAVWMRAVKTLRRSRFAIYRLWERINSRIKMRTMLRWESQHRTERWQTAIAVQKADRHQKEIFRFFWDYWLFILYTPEQRQKTIAMLPKSNLINRHLKSMTVGRWRHHVGCRRRLGVALRKARIKLEAEAIQSWLQYQSRSAAISQAGSAMNRKYKKELMLETVSEWARKHYLKRAIMRMVTRGGNELLVHVLEAWSRPRHQLRKQKGIVHTLIEEMFTWHSLRFCGTVFSSWKARLVEQIDGEYQREARDECSVCDSKEVAQALPMHHLELKSVFSGHYDPFILNAIPYFLQTISLRLAVLCAASMHQQCEHTTRACVNYVTESIKTLQAATNYMVYSIRKELERNSENICDEAFLAWKALVAQARARGRKSAKATSRLLHRFLSAWRLAIVSQRDVCLSAIIISDQVIPDSVTSDSNYSDELARDDVPDGECVWVPPQWQREMDKDYGKRGSVLSRQKMRTETVEFFSENDYDDSVSVSSYWTNSSRSSIWDQDESCLFHPSPLASLGFSTFAVSSFSERPEDELMKDYLVSWKQYVASKPRSRRKTSKRFGSKSNSRRADKSALLSAFWADAAKQMAQAKTLVSSFIDSVSMGSATETCRCVVARWRDLAVRVKKSQRKFKEAILRCMLQCFSEWRVFATRQRDLSASASTIAAQWEREMRLQKASKRSGKARVKRDGYSSDDSPASCHSGYSSCRHECSRSLFDSASPASAEACQSMEGAIQAYLEVSMAAVPAAVATQLRLGPSPHLSSAGFDTTEIM